MKGGYVDRLRVGGRIRPVSHDIGMLVLVLLLGGMAVAGVVFGVLKWLVILEWANR